jgi:hypothetical protein
MIMSDLAPVQRAVNALCRRDFQAFVERVFRTLAPADELERAPYLEVLCDHLAQTARGDIKRLLITVPPRHLKTITASVALPAWVLGHNPSKQIVSLCYAEPLARKYSDQFRTVMRRAGTRMCSRKLRRASPGTRRPNSKLVSRARALVPPLEGR